LRGGSLDEIAKTPMNVLSLLKVIAFCIFAVVGIVFGIGQVIHGDKLGWGYIGFGVFVIALCLLAGYVNYRTRRKTSQELDNEPLSERSLRKPSNGTGGFPP
jgi:hypothetical protein